MRGKFNYRSVMGEAGKVLKFSVFVEKEGMGATVVEIAADGSH